MSRRAAGVIFVVLGALLYLGGAFCEAFYDAIHVQKAPSPADHIRWAAAILAAGGVAFLVYAEMLEWRRRPRPAPHAEIAA